MMRLLIQRGSVLLLRPVAVLAEGAFVPGGNVLIHVLPIAAMALTASSVPVHLQFMIMAPGKPERQAVARAYVGGLVNVTLIALSILSAILLVVWPAIDPVLLLSICCVFLVEKFSDELTRYFEFGKRYNLWFAVQVARSGWLFVPILLAASGYAYDFAFLASALISALASTTLFFIATGLKPRFSIMGWGVMRTNGVFLSGAILLALHRQGPRIVVAHLFPQVAHVFQAVAQLGQGASLLFNIKYQIPYRRLIARRPMLFERRFEPIFKRLLWLAFGMTAVGLAVHVILPASPDAADGTILTSLVPIMIADALAFSVLSAYFGYMPWLSGGRKVLATYATGAILLLSTVGISYAVLTKASDFVEIVPTLMVALSALWIWLVRHRHFTPRERHVGS